MKNVNLTGLYMALILKCDIRGFELSGLRKIDNPEPYDMTLDFVPMDITSVNIDEVKNIVVSNIDGEVKQVSVSIIEDSKVHIYVEFMNSDWNDDYAYPKN